MTRSPEEIEAEIERTRLEVDRTVEALKEKMSPEKIVHDVMDAVRDRGSAFLETAGEQVRKHPAPAAILIGGLGLLAWRASRKSRARPATDETLWNNVEPRFGGYQRGYEGGYGMHDPHLEGRGQGRQGSSPLRAAERTFQRTLDQDPLIIGAVAVVIGAAIGAALPTTRVEHRYLGRVREDAMARMRGMARERVEDVKEAVSAARGRDKSEPTDRREPGEPGVV